MEELETSDKFFKRGIGPTFNCCFYHDALEFHQHLFFVCNFSWKILKEFVLNDQFFLIASTLTQGFYACFFHESQNHIL